MPWHIPKTWTKEPLTSSDMNAQVRDNMEHLKAHEVPTGTLLPFGGDAAPYGWLLCYGQSLPRDTYATLFDVIGTKFGSQSGTTFSLPDMRGRIPLGKDNMGGASANRVTATQADTIGQASGAEKHTLTTAEMPSHTHKSLEGITFKDPAGSPHHENNAGRFYADMWQPDDAPYYTGSTGSNQPHNNMPPYLTLNYIIKT